MIVVLIAIAGRGVQDFCAISMRTARLRRQGVVTIAVALVGSTISYDDQTEPLLAQQIQVYHCGSLAELWSVLPKIGGGQEEPMFLISAEGEFVPILSKALDEHKSAGVHISLCARKIDFEMPVDTISVDGSSNYKGLKNYHSEVIDLGVYIVSKSAIRLAASSKIGSIANLAEFIKENISEPHLIFV